MASERPMHLKATTLEYEFEDESGYRFKVTAERKKRIDAYGEEFDGGWTATVTMSTSGLRTPRGAVAHLRHSAEAFLRQTKAVKE